jgi:hypothetical protein
MNKIYVQTDGLVKNNNICKNYEYNYKYNYN